MIKLTQADILGNHQPNMVEPRELSAFEFHDILSSLIFFQTSDIQVNNIQMQTPQDCARVCIHSHYYPQECQKIGSRRNEGKIALVAKGTRRIVSERHNSLHLKSKTKKK